jgi:hypothetical protein
MTKRLTPLGLALLLAVTLVPITGCETTQDAVQRAQIIDDTAILLRSAARNGAMLAIEDHPESAKYFELARAVIADFATGTDYSPDAFKAAMQANIKQLNDKWVKFGVYNVTDLYELYYGRYVRDQVNGNVVANKFLNAIQEGFKQALESKP